MDNFYNAMQEVLKRPRYDILTGRAIDHFQIIRDAILETIGRALLNMLEGMQVNVPDMPDYNTQAIATVFIIVTVVLLLIIIIAIILFVLRRRGKIAREEATLSSIFDDIANKRFTLADLLQISQEYAKKGQYRDAVRHRYVAVLVALNDKQAIRVEKSKTNAQLSKEFKEAKPLLSEAFDSIIDIFQQSWFGMKPLDEIRYQDFTSFAERVEDKV